MRRIVHFIASAGRTPSRVLTSATVVLAALLCPLVMASWQDPTEPARLRILVTNDDGIDAPGLLALVQALSAEADVVVSAPAENRSGSSHSIAMLSAPLVVTERSIPGAVAAWAVSGTPADAAAFGIIHGGVETPFDVVISGINAGDNVGASAHLSGTVGAAMEGARLGVPALAISRAGRGNDFTDAADAAKHLLEALKREGALLPSVVYSINIPGLPPEQVKGIAPARMGPSTFEIASFEREEQADGTVTYRARFGRPAASPPAESDAALLVQGFITITPLRFDLTDTEALERLRALSW